MNLTITPIPQQTFKGNLKYKAIRNIPNVPCACCGQRTILNGSIKSAYKSLAKPLSLMLAKGVLRSWEKVPFIWNLLNTWAIENPKSSLDRMVYDDPEKFGILRGAVEDNVKSNPANANLDENEISRTTSRLFDDIYSRSRAELRGSAAVMKRLRAFKDCLKATKREIFEQFEIYSRKYPRKTLSEIINMEEIYKFHAAKDILQRAETREKLDYHFDNIAKILKKSKAFSDDEIAELKESSIRFIANMRDEDARIPAIKDLYKKALESHNQEKLKFKIFDELKQIPTTFITKDSFLAYAHNHHYTDSNIIDSLLTPSISSFEHIIPRSQDGENKTTNGIVLCTECNTRRKTRPYTEFIQYHPRMPYNTQKQIDFVSQLILKGKIDGPLRFWPIKVAQTLTEYTGGAIAPDVTEYALKELHKSQERILENNRAVHDLKNEQIEKFRKRADLQDEIDSIDSDLAKIHEQFRVTRSIDNYESALSTSIRRYLKNK